MLTDTYLPGIFKELSVFRWKERRDSPPEQGTHTENGEKEAVWMPAAPWRGLKV